MRITTIEPQISQGATSAMLADVAPLSSERVIACQNGIVGEVRVKSTVLLKSRTFAAIHVRLQHRYGNFVKIHYFTKPRGNRIMEIEETEITKGRLEQVRQAMLKSALEDKNR